GAVTRFGNHDQAHDHGDQRRRAPYRRLAGTAGRPRVRSPGQGRHRACLALGCNAVRLVAGVSAGQGKTPATCILHIRRVGGACPTPGRPMPDGYPRHCRARPAPAETRTLTGAIVTVPQRTLPFWRSVMSLSQSAAPYEAPPTPASPPPRRARRPAVETIAGWSARHRKTAIFGWLALVAVAYLIGQLLGSPGLQQNDLGQAGQAEQTLQHLGVTTPATESVLVQERAQGQTFATDPAMRQAVSQVTAALARVPGAATVIRSPLSPGGQALVSANGRSALVTFTVPGPAADVNSAVTPALTAVA